MNCRNPVTVHPCDSVYAKRYNGYCFDCHNLGVPELVDEIDNLKRQLSEAQQRVWELSNDPRNTYGAVTPSDD